MRDSHYHTRRKRNFLLRVVLVILCSGWLLWPLIAHGKILAFRDALHFYYPLWTDLDQREGLAWLLPQFNYLDRIGASIIGEPTSGIFYPLRSILAFRSISIESRIGILLATHLAIAWLCCYFSGRYAFRMSTFAASVAASAYALGGCTFFQIYNPPYLFSAAWLPLSFGSLYYLIFSGHSRRSKWKWQLALVVSISAMIVGGDFQLPYNLGIVAVALGLVHAAGSESRNEWIASFKSTATVGILVLLAVGICAVQVVPTYCWAISGASNGSFLRSGVSDRYVLQFADLFTWLVPNVNGSYTFTHTRWIAALNRSPMWVASMHLSAIVVAGAFISPALLGKSQKIRHLAIVCFLALWASLGSSFFLYRLLCYLPFYDSFRYPMKWCVIFTLALCLLGGLAVQAAQRSSRIRELLNRSLVFFGSSNLVLFVTTLVIVTPFGRSAFLSNLTVPQDLLCGAFDFAACTQLVGKSSGTTAMSFFGCWMLFRGPLRNTLQAWRGQLIEIICLCQVTFLASQLVATTGPQSLADAPVADFVWQTETSNIPVYFSPPSVLDPEADEFRSSPQRPDDVAAFQMRHAYGKLHLLQGYRSLTAQLSVEPSFYQDFQPQVVHLQPATIPASGDFLVNVELLDESIRLASEENQGASEENQGGEIVLPVLQDGGWTLETGIENGSRIVLRDDYLLQVHLPSQVQHVKLSYLTPGLRIGTMISVTVFLITFLYFLFKYYVREAASRAA